MLLSFERGSPTQPKGHALAYFKNTHNPGEIYATYLVVPPITIDLVKYMPPMFASNIPLSDMENVSAIPLPPLPEKVESVDYIQHLAERREDDVLFLGTLDPKDMQAVLTRVTDAAQEYLRQVSAYIQAAPRVAEREPVREPSPALSASVDDVLYGLMTDRDKLGEMVKLVGKLRYAVEGRDRSLVSETLEELQAVGRHLPERYRVRDIIAAAQTAGEKGRVLSELHVSRCYKLSDEDFRAVEEIEARIRQVESQ